MGTAGAEFFTRPLRGRGDRLSRHFLSIVERPSFQSTEHALIVCHPAPPRILRCVSTRPLEGRVKEDSTPLAFLPACEILLRQQPEIQCRNNQQTSLSSAQASSAYPQPMPPANAACRSCSS